MERIGERNSPTEMYSEENIQDNHVSNSKKRKSSSSSSSSPLQQHNQLCDFNDSDDFDDVSTSKRIRFDDDVCDDDDKSKKNDKKTGKMTADEAERKRILANSQERDRMNKLNSALAALRKVLPPEYRVSRRLSKIRTLQVAIRYIQGLSELLAEDDAINMTAGQFPGAPNMYPGAPNMYPGAPNMYASSPWAQPWYQQQWSPMHYPPTPECVPRVPQPYDVHQFFQTPSPVPHQHQQHVFPVPASPQVSPGCWPHPHPMEADRVFAEQIQSSGHVSDVRSNQTGGSDEGYFSSPFINDSQRSSFVNDNQRSSLVDSHMSSLVNDNQRSSFVSDSQRSSFVTDSLLTPSSHLTTSFLGEPRHRSSSSSTCLLNESCERSSFLCDSGVQASFLQSPPQRTACMKENATSSFLNDCSVGVTSPFDGSCPNFASTPVGPVPHRVPSVPSRVPSVPSVPSATQGQQHVFNNDEDQNTKPSSCLFADTHSFCKS